MIKHTLAALWLSILAPTTTIAAENIHLACVTQNPSSKDWVPKGVIVRVTAGTLQAAVLDEFTTQVFGSSVAAELSRPTPSRVRLKWKLIGAKDRKGRAQNVDFKMSINLKSGKFTYQGLSESFFVTPGAAQGRCAEVKDK